MADVVLLAGEPRSGETSRAMQACNDYLRMGPRRSLPTLAAKYTKLPKTAQPTDSLDTLKKWSVQFGWVERAATYDSALDAKKTVRARKVMGSGLALTHERVVELKKLAAFLLKQLYEQDDDGKHLNLWLADVKQVGYGEYAERVDLVRFNDRLISELRGTLDDLAKETGGRRQKMDVNLDEGDVDAAIECELAELARLRQGAGSTAHTPAESGDTRSE